MNRLRALVARIVALMALVLALAPARARADEPEVAKTPRDVPMLVQPSAVKIPSYPPTYQAPDLGWLTIAYPPAAHERVQPLLDHADEIKAELTDALGQSVLAKPIEVRVATSPEDMASLAPPDVPTYASAVAFPGLRLIILSMRAPFTQEGTDLEHELRHELAHMALEDAVAGQHVPAWFNEGFAMHASGETFERISTLTQATLWKTLIPLADLDRSMPADATEASVAYAESADFLRFLLRQSDRRRFAGMIDRTRKGEPFDHALSDAYGADLRKLEYEWREDLAKKYTFWPVLLGGSSLWVIVIAALGVGLVKKRRRAKAIYDRWEREDAVEAARRAALAHAAAATDAAPAPDASMRPSVPSVPKIEHDGGWHTLH
jgi:hypothetical protein